MSLNKGINLENLLDTIVQICFGTIKTLPEEKIEQLNDYVNKMIEKEAEEKNNFISEKNKSEVEKMQEITNAFFEFIQRPEIIEAIRHGTLNQNDLLKLSKENIMKVSEQKCDTSDLHAKTIIEKDEEEDIAKINERKYDMSDLYDGTLIEKDENEPNLKNVSLHLIEPKKINSFEFENHGERIVISNIGQLNYQEANTAHNYLNYYRINKIMPNGEEKIRDVFTDIVIADMQEIMYRKAVLEELLKDNNIELANCGGYIGKIIPRKQIAEMESENIEKQTNQYYYYPINSEYGLLYEAKEVSAAIDFYTKQNGINIKGENKGTEQRGKNKNEGDSLGER